MIVTALQHFLRESFALCYDCNESASKGEAESKTSIGAPGLANKQIAQVTKSYFENEGALYVHRNLIRATTSIFSGNAHDYEPPDWALSPFVLLRSYRTELRLHRSECSAAFMHTGSAAKLMVMIPLRRFPAYLPRRRSEPTTNWKLHACVLFLLGQLTHTY